MADRVVLDASVAVALLVDESGSHTARGLAAGWETSGAELVVPSHFWLELTNVLVRRRGRSAAEALEGIILIDAFQPQTVELERAGLLLALDAMDRHGLSAYDAAYIAVAQSMDARLATLDRRLAGAALDVGVPVEPFDARRLAEQPGCYAADRGGSGWLGTAAAGRYIADLRRQTEARSGTS